MKKLLTNNFGLKIFSLLIAFVLWIFVLNIDDPVISRTYTGIPVEVTNTDAITKQGKVYQVLEGSDMISVVVSAKRSVIEKMSRDYIKASADMKDITFMNTVSIDVKSSKYSDRIESITPLTKNLKVQIEDLLKIQYRINIETDGSPLKGYVIGSVTPNVNVVSVSGPKSIVSKISTAEAIVDVDNFSSDISTNSSIKLLDGNGDLIKQDLLKLSIDSVHIDVEVLETKEIPIVASATGTVADGYAVTGEVLVSPESVVVAGSGSAFEDLSQISIPADAVSVDGASDNVSVALGIKKYLPTGVRVEDESKGVVSVTAKVGKLEVIPIDIPTANFSLVNVPAGYGAAIVDIGGLKRVNIQGFPEDLSVLDPTTILGTIDASAMIPHGGLKEGESYFSGLNDGLLNLNLPEGIRMKDSEYMQVSLYLLGEDVNIPTETVIEKQNDNM